MIHLFLREIRIEHTLFALPFAYVGAVIGTHGHPTILQLCWITLAVLGARTAAMAANRLFDRDIDARNPRTAQRKTATGKLSPHVMASAIGIGLLLTLLAAYELNPLCMLLLPLAALGIVVYPFCKRFTWLAHFVLGAVDGFAPLGAMVAVTGTITLPALLLFLSVTLWVSGFDIPYALMDIDIDRTQGLFSIPARFGVSVAQNVALLLHGLMALTLLSTGLLARAHPLFFLGPLGAILLIIYEYSLLRNQTDLSALNDHLFNANMLFSLWFLLTTVGGYSTFPMLHLLDT